MSEPVSMTPEEFADEVRQVGVALSSASALDPEQRQALAARLFAALDQSPYGRRPPRPTGEQARRRRMQRRVRTRSPEPSPEGLSLVVLRS
jgi:hypothetical protein